MPDVAGDRTSLDETTTAIRTRNRRRQHRLLIPALLIAGFILLPTPPWRGERADASTEQTAETGDQAMRDESQDKRIDYIELPAVDIGAMKKFYGEAFGWTFVDYGPDYCSFNDGRMGVFARSRKSSRGDRWWYYSRPTWKR